MKKMAFLLLTFAFTTQAQDIQHSENTVKKTFNTDYINAANNMDSSRFCLYKDVLYTENSVVKMEDILMECTDVDSSFNGVKLEWRRSH